MTLLPFRSMPTRSPVALTSLVALSLLAPLCARAQVAVPESSTSSAATAAISAASVPDGDPARVEITALREPLEFPYRRAYDAAVKVRDASHASTDLVVTLVEAHPVTALPLRVSLQYGDKIEPLQLDSSNTFTLSPNRAALEQNAVLTANRRRGGLSVQVGLRPHVEPGATLTRADINRLVDGGKAARKSLLPWYARIVMPTVSAVRLCTLDPAAQFGLRDSDGGERSLPTKDDKDAYDRPAHCVDLPPTADAREAAMSVVMPRDSTVDYAASAF